MSNSDVKSKAPVMFEKQAAPTATIAIAENLNVDPALTPVSDPTAAAIQVRSLAFYDFRTPNVNHHPCAAFIIIVKCFGAHLSFSDA